MLHDSTSVRDAFPATTIAMCNPTGNASDTAKEATNDGEPTRTADQSHDWKDGSPRKGND